MRAGNLAGLTIATVCGIATAYTTLQPALQEEAERKKAGTFGKEHDGGGGGGGGGENDSTTVGGSGRSSKSSTRGRDQDTQLSRAILSDLKEAKREAIGEDRGNGGFAWGIRKWFSSPAQASSVQTESVAKKDESDAARGLGKGKE